jgi:wobble nucleotide-excising tRNase
MVLKKVISIRNVGRFASFGATGDVMLRRYNLVFAENGRGKTTLCAILRSLQSGEPAPILGRKTLGVSEEPDVEILLDGGSLAVFRDGQWTSTVPHLAVFDEVFVNSNVYSGDAVTIDQKRGLYGVVIGERGVGLARRVAELDAAIRDKNPEIREKRAAVQGFAPPGVPVEEFLTLPEDAAVDARIADRQRQLAAAEKAEQIRARDPLSQVALPDLPPGFTECLAKSMAGIAGDIETRVRAHIRDHEMQATGQAWLADGLEFVRDEACPFCGQSLSDVELVRAYEVYFSDAFNDLRDEIAKVRESIDAVLGEREIARVEQQLVNNVSGMQFWSEYGAVAPLPPVDIEELVGALRAVQVAAIALLDRKAAAPVDVVPVDNQLTEALDGLAALGNALSAYKEAVDAANTVIGSQKESVAAADVNETALALERLQAVKRRHENEAKTACAAYASAEDEKESLATEKDKVKKQLDQHTEQVISQYEDTINRLLGDFHAGFRISGTCHGYPGGVPSCTYNVVINDTPIELGDRSTPLEEPSFRNTLSSGDRSTLALAFFLAQLEHDPVLATRAVVFDDPFNSQDSFRKDCTVRMIKQCGQSAAQVIVLSHDQEFLKRIWERLGPDSAERKSLKLARKGIVDTALIEWDIELATQAQFVQNLNALLDYHKDGEGSPADVITKIRPVLETHCRLMDPSELVNLKLGEIVGKVRDTGPSHPLHGVLDSLDAINDYTRGFHHGDKPGSPRPTINDTELQGYVAKTLDIVGYCSS